VYRYILRREVADLRTAHEGAFVMLNPSVADDTTDDPTIRRCSGFAKSFGWRGFVVINLFAARCTDPHRLAGMMRDFNIIGPENDAMFVALAADRTRPVVAAWGVAGGNLARFRAAEIIQRVPINWKCLGTTQDGSPRHPLFVKADAPLVAWDAHRWLRRHFGSGTGGLVSP